MYTKHNLTTHFTAHHAITGIHTPNGIYIEVWAVSDRLRVGRVNKVGTVRPKALAYSLMWLLGLWYR